MRAEVSKKSKWYIPKERYYELKHFCLQYTTWIEERRNISLLHEQNMKEKVQTSEISDATAALAELTSFYTDRINLVTKVIDLVSTKGTQESDLLFQAVITGSSYDRLEALYGSMPISRDEWYLLYRRFFWELDKWRDVKP